MLWADYPTGLHHPTTSRPGVYHEPTNSLRTMSPQDDDPATYFNHIGCAVIGCELRFFAPLPPHPRVQTFIETLTLCGVWYKGVQGGGGRKFRRQKKRCKKMHINAFASPPPPSKWRM